MKMKKESRGQRNMGTMKEQANRIGHYRKYCKRPMDIILSFCALVVLSPLLLIVAILVRIKLGSPILFKQKRPGLNEKIFTIYKFRTMTNERDASGELLPDSVRLTKFGKILRSTSIDELPELWNVIWGKMSIIGPRPLAIVYLPYYNSNEKHRHDVRPGLSGLAQICGRNALSWEDRFGYDTQYEKNISFLTDMKIIFMTINKVFKREGVIIRDNATTLDFNVYREKIEQKRRMI